MTDLLFDLTKQTYIGTFFTFAVTILGGAITTMCGLVLGNQPRQQRPSNAQREPRNQYE